MGQDFKRKKYKTLIKWLRGGRFDLKAMVKRKKVDVKKEEKIEKEERKTLFLVLLRPG